MQAKEFGEDCKGHNRQLIATVLPLFFAIKTVLPKSQNTKIFGNKETFGNKKYEDGNIQKQSNLQMLIFQKISLGKIARGTTGNLLQLFYHYFLQ